MPLGDEVTSLLHQTLFSDLDVARDGFAGMPHLLSHYTSIETLESIVRSEELWLSNPLFMNDLEEVRFGIIEGSFILRESKSIRDSLGSEGRFADFVRFIDHCQSAFEEKYLLDTYVFCLCEHDDDNNDGILSMWRGYGGNGSGVAVVFDTSKIPETPDSPLIFSRVHYGTTQERIAWINSLAGRAADFMSKNDITDDSIFDVAYHTFHRLILFSLFSKHRGFSEEREWRIVYMREHDRESKMEKLFHYQNGLHGVQPKLRLPIKPMDGVTSGNISIDEIVHQIILGPTSSSPLSRRSIERMLTLLSKPSLASKVVASTIPFRAR